MAILNPLNLLEIDTRYFEGRLDGKCSMAPQMTLGISGEAELPKDKQDYRLCDLAEFHFTFFAGVVPVDICLQPNLSAHVNAGVTLGLMGKAGAKVKLWKIELFDWEFDLKFGPQWELMTNNKQSIWRIQKKCLSNFTNKEPALLENMKAF